MSLKSVPQSLFLSHLMQFSKSSSVCSLRCMTFRTSVGCIVGSYILSHQRWLHVTTQGYHQPYPKTIMILTESPTLFLKTFVKFFKCAKVQTGSVKAHDPSVNTLWTAVKILAGFCSPPHFSCFVLLF